MPIGMTDNQMTYKETCPQKITFTFSYKFPVTGVGTLQA